MSAVMARMCFLACVSFDPLSVVAQNQTAALDLRMVQGWHGMSRTERIGEKGFMKCSIPNPFMCFPETINLHKTRMRMRILC